MALASVHTALFEMDGEALDLADIAVAQQKPSWQLMKLMLLIGRCLDV